MIKVDTSSSYVSRARSKKASKTAFKVETSFSAAPSNDTNEVSSLKPMAISSLMDLQEINTVNLSMEEWVQHGKKLLNTLQDLQLEWLEGSQPHETLLKLQAELEDPKGEITDPSLKETIKYITQRVAVELEKARQRSPGSS